MTSGNGSQSLRSWEEPQKKKQFSADLDKFCQSVYVYSAGMCSLVPLHPIIGGDGEEGGATDQPVGEESFR